jgi:cytoskeletal protein CcmA (bactofilin family)
MFNNPKKPPSGVAETTIIAAGVVVRGDVHFTGSLHLEGRVEGVISADADSTSLFTLSEKGSVAGEINVPHAVINGTVEGDIHCARRLELAAGARIRGDVYYAVLEMAAGALVNGRVIHEEAAPRQLPRLAEAPEEAASGHVVHA